MKRSLAVITLASLFLAASGYACLTQAQSWGREAGLAATDESSLRLMQSGDSNWDLDSCQQDCRSRYGLDVLGSGGGPGGTDKGTYYLYARCIEDCNRRFWKKFDQETGDTK